MIRRALGWVPRALGHPLNTVVGLALLVYLVVFPLAGIAVSSNSELIGGNFTNAVSYLGASIAAGASVVGLHESRKHRAEDREHRKTEAEHREAERAASARRERHLAQIRAHLAAARHLHAPIDDPKDDPE